MLVRRHCDSAGEREFRQSKQISLLCRVHERIIALCLTCHDDLHDMGVCIPFHVEIDGGNTRYISNETKYDL